MATKPPTLRPSWRKPRTEAEKDRKAQVDRKRAGSPARKLYGTARWRELRTAWLSAHPLCQCPACQEGAIRTTAATVVDHIRPHRGDERLFFDPANLMSMAKPCHDRKTATQDSGFARQGARG